MTQKLTGKTALIVGASAGIGLASARLFVEHGANVVLVGRSQPRLQAAAGEIGEQALPVVADIQHLGQLEAAFEAAIDRFGELHIIFNNAGPGGDGRPRRIPELAPEQFDEYIAVNLRAVWFAMKLGIPLLSAAGGGSIISTSSVGAVLGSGGVAAYSAAKAGVHALTRAAAAETIAQNIRVNCIVPGAVATRFGLPTDAEQTPNMLQDRRDLFATFSPNKRSGEPEEIANLALFLASDDASFITGQCLRADGGMTAVNGWLPTFDDV